MFPLVIVESPCVKIQFHVVVARPDAHLAVHQPGLDELVLVAREQELLIEELVAIHGEEVILPAHADCPRVPASHVGHTHRGLLAREAL